MKMRKLLSWASAGALAGAMFVAGSPPGSAQDVGSATVVPIQVTGDPANRLNLVILGDGYTAEEMGDFRAAVEHHLNVQWSIEPYRSYRNYFNVYAIEIISGESGVGCDPDLDSPRPDTPLNMAFWGGCNPNSVQRLLSMDSQAANQYASMVPGVTSANRQILALANSDTYGGAGGTFATASADNALAALISPHELGHSLGGLQDEYSYFARNQNRGDDPSSGEPSSIHHTRMTSEQMIATETKWWRWLGEESESGGLIRAAGPDGYEGGQYWSGNVWRPSQNSIMKSLGYYYDQVSRERMTQRISERTPLVDAFRLTDAPVGTNEVVWVDTLHPVYHELDVVWRINGAVVPGTGNSGSLALEALDVTEGDTVSATIQDPTEFVRDPVIRNSRALTRTLSWTVGDEPVPPTSPPVEFTSSTQTARAVGHDDVVYVQTPHPSDRELDVTWELDGEVVDNPGHSRVLDLARLALPVGTHQLMATLSDPAGAGTDTLTWTVDNTGPATSRELSEPLVGLPGDTEHNVYFDEFTLGLEPSDDQPGVPVAELRVDDDGWHHYYGWPTDPQLPFRFTHSGTNVDDLIYGSLGSGGLSKAPFEQLYGPADPNGAFVPGYGTHTVRHRAIDAASNHGEPKAFVSTVLPGASPACTTTVTGAHNGTLRVSSGVTCLDGAWVNGGVTVAPGGSLVASDSVINGRLSSVGADTVQLFGTTVNSQTQITRTTTDVTAAGNTFNGSLTLRNNTQVPHNAGAERFSQFGFEYGPILAGNLVNGSLTCQVNSAPVRDFGASNTTRGQRLGECADL